MLTEIERTFIQSPYKFRYTDGYQRQIRHRIRKKVIKTYADLMLLEQHRDQWDTKNGVLSDVMTATRESRLGIIYSKRIQGKRTLKALIKELQQQLKGG